MILTGTSLDRGDGGDEVRELFQQFGGADQLEARLRQVQHYCPEGVMEPVVAAAWRRRLRICTREKKL